MAAKKETIEQAHERGYIEGRRRTLINQLTSTLGELGGLPGGDSPEIQLARMTMERQETVATLRGLCRTYGDLDWEDDLHLQDILESHLVKHLLHGKRGR